MKLLISGVCGFAGSTLVRALIESAPDLSIWGIDNFIRPGSQTNVAALKQLGVRVRHGDVRASSDFEGLPDVDWVIDCAANPSVLAGVDGQTSSRQVVEHNLGGTINLLEYCKRSRAGFVLLSTSRVYSIEAFAGIPLKVEDRAFAPDLTAVLPAGLTAKGASEAFSSAAPISLYGATKLASEAMALEYGSAFNLPVFVNRCGVLAGAGQFGRADQGIYAYWIHMWARRRPLKYLGFGGHGHQVRDCLHPADLAPLLLAQMKAGQGERRRLVNLSGGVASRRSLRQLSEWCAQRFGAHEVAADGTVRPFDLPWVVLDSSLAEQVWGWRPRRTTEDILEEIARQAESEPGWLELSAPL
ncbi:MAG TPA: NAD-dependent epimerase/dehydratase family protein [Opitutaceae bacterium]|jgi:CDP-paratose 2-epimerase